MRERDQQPATPESSVAELGRRSGAHDREQGRRYGKVNGAYPSNPYHVSDPRCDVFNKEWEGAWRT